MLSYEGHGFMGFLSLNAQYVAIIISFLGNNSKFGRLWYIIQTFDVSKMLSKLRFSEDGLKIWFWLLFCVCFCLFMSFEPSGCFVVLHFFLLIGLVCEICYMRVNSSNIKFNPIVEILFILKRGTHSVLYSLYGTYTIISK